MPEIVGRIPGVKEYKFPQSPSCPEAPWDSFRLCIASNTVGSKTTNILNMCLQQKFYRNVFSAIILVSPSLGVDDMLNPLLRRMEQLGQDPDRDSRNDF